MAITVKGMFKATIVSVSGRLKGFCLKYYRSLGRIKRYETDLWKKKKVGVWGSLWTRKLQ